MKPFKRFILLCSFYLSLLSLFYFAFLGKTLSYENIRFLAWIEWVLFAYFLACKFTKWIINDKNQEEK